MLIGHSLGGMLAAIFAASAPNRLNGLVMLASPLCFEDGSSRFRDAFVALAPPAPSEGLVPGSFVSTLSVMAAPSTFLGALPLDTAFSMLDPRAAELNARLQRWLLDETPVPSILAKELLEWVFKQNLFCRGELNLGNGPIGPSTMLLPTLAVVSPDDEIAPPSSVEPFLEQFSDQTHCKCLSYRGEIGTGFPHLAILVGRTAHREVWPEIIEWISDPAGHHRVHK